MSDHFQIPKDFGKVLLVLGAMNLQMQTAGMAVGVMRKRIFNKNFMEKNFGKQHREELKE